MNQFIAQLTPEAEIYLYLLGLALWVCTICAPIIAVLAVRALWVRRHPAVTRDDVAALRLYASQHATLMLPIAAAARYHGNWRDEAREEIQSAGKVSNSMFGR